MYRHGSQTPGHTDISLQYPLESDHDFAFFLKNLDTVHLVGKNTKWSLKILTPNGE